MFENGVVFVAGDIRLDDQVGGRPAVAVHLLSDGGEASRSWEYDGGAMAGPFTLRDGRRHSIGSPLAWQTGGDGVRKRACVDEGVRESLLREKHSGTRRSWRGPDRLTGRSEEHAFAGREVGCGRSRQDTQLFEVFPFRR